MDRTVTRQTQMSRSHAGTVVPECYKDKIQSQWKAWNSTPAHDPPQRRTRVVVQTIEAYGQLHLEVRWPRRSHHVKGSEKAVVFEEAETYRSFRRISYYYCQQSLRPVLEYACVAWHSSLTKAQTKALEDVQRRAFQIINNNISYE